MRRIVLVGEPMADGASEWLRTLPIGGLTVVANLDDAALGGADVVWLRRPVRADTRLPDWLHAGGRLLATHAASAILSTLGVEPASPVAIPLPTPLPTDFGLAGFGLHPLFSGLRDGAVIAPAPHAPGGALGYLEGSRPRVAGVVAVERRGFELRELTTLAWECAVGAGGALCLAFEPSLDREPSARREAELVLANALLGDAIPHRDRAGPVTLWPKPGRAALWRESPAPPLVAPTDPWPPTSLPLLDLTPAAGWTLAGRRALVSARPGSATREVWAPPFRIMRDAMVRDAIPCAPGHLAGNEIAGGLAIGGHRLLERWLAAADTPVVVWEVGGLDGVEIETAWVIDLHRSWPFPDGAYGDLEFAVSADGACLGVETAAGPQARFAARGGRLEAIAEAGRALVRVSCRGVTPLRIVAAAGADPQELERAVRVLKRDGVAGLAAARARKAAQLQRYGTAFEAPDDLLARGFAWARQRGDEALIGVPGVGRSVLTPCPSGAGEGGWCFGPRACAGAAALLVAGNRDPARELLKFLAQAQHPGGGIPATLPVGGLASAPAPSGTLAFLELAERLRAWTGDEEGLRRLRDPLARALAYLAEFGGPAPDARVLDALEAVLDRTASAAISELRAAALAAPIQDGIQAHAIVEAAAAALRRGPGALLGAGAAPALLESVVSLWGLEPDAPEAALGVAPSLPSGWQGFALRRLRVGRSLLDLEIRRRPEAVVLRVAHLFGPRLVLTASLRGQVVDATEVDGEPLPASRARFETHDRHEVRFHLRG
ncbi:MAG: hypothetical protein ACREOQ_17930 [Gemmatimonadales bacterium]